MLDKLMQAVANLALLFSHLYLKLDLPSRSVLYREEYTPEEVNAVILL